MKKRFALLTALVLMLMATPLAMATDLGFETIKYGLEEKADLQILAGSGLRGEIAIEMTGDTLLSSLLGEGFLDAKIAFSLVQFSPFIKDKQIAINVLDGEKEISNLIVDALNNDLVLGGMLLNGNVYSLPLHAALSALLPKDDGKELPSYEQVMYKLVTISDEALTQELETALAPYTLELEMWLAEYAKMDNQDQSALAIESVIPQKDILAKIKQLFPALIADANVDKVITQVLSEEEKAVYYDASKVENYLKALEAVSLGGDIHIKQIVSAKSEESSIVLTLPMPANAYGMTEAIVTLNGKDTALEVDTAWGALLLTHSENDAKAQGIIRFMPKGDEAQGSALSMKYTFQKTQKEWKDDDKRDNLSNTYQITLTPDHTHLVAKDEAEMDALLADYIDFEPISIEYITTYRSGASQTSPLYGTVALVFAQGEADTKVNATYKTCAPWLAQAQDKAAAKVLIPTDQDAVSSAIADVAKGIAAVMQHFTPAMAPKE